MVYALAAGKVALEQSPLGPTAVRKLEGLEQYSTSPTGAGEIQVLDKEEFGSAEAFLNRVRKAISDPEATK